jgi:imidazoleglycerol-phosphate dehydratase
MKRGTSATEPEIPRQGRVERNTKETQIVLQLDIDGAGASKVETGIPFFSHMLEAWAKHGLMDLTVDAKGDLEVDHHHTVEDVGICLGKALVQALGDKQGIVRYGSKTLPMEETLVTSALDLSGRSWFVYRVTFATEKIGAFDTELVETFWQALAANALLNLHLVLHHGSNSHHVAEARGSFRTLGSQKSNVAHARNIKADQTIGSRVCSDCPRSRTGPGVTRSRCAVWALAERRDSRGRTQ